MNVKVEIIELAPCKKQLRFELPAEDVDVAFTDTTKQFQKQANLPGFRKGKAPLAKVQVQFAKDIESRVRDQLLNDSYRKGVEDNKLKPILDPEVEEVNFKQGEAFGKTVVQTGQGVRKNRNFKQGKAFGKIAISNRARRSRF